MQRMYSVCAAYVQRTYSVRTAYDSVPAAYVTYL